MGRELKSLGILTSTIGFMLVLTVMMSGNGTPKPYDDPCGFSGGPSLFQMTVDFAESPLAQTIAETTLIVGGSLYATGRRNEMDEREAEAENRREAS